MSEFDGLTHYLKGPSGEDVEPSAEVPEVVCDSGLSNQQVWGYSIAGAVIAAAMSLVGALTLIPTVLKSNVSVKSTLAGTSIFNAFSVSPPPAGAAAW
jgi:hypothetical protein